ncbi:hypothetical protein DL95DRAFT_414301 [Leptodontidium sp. 2 PMI_412]|nr:hypothetical protein DL95DRAFT_414301 [Leptodontidium sp. 2 PMI_412]
MCLTTAFEHPMPGELRPSFSNENRGGASLLRASSKIQGQQSIANSDFEFESAPPNRQYETGINATMPNMLGSSQASTVAHTPVWTPLPYPAAGQQGWHSEPAAHANMQSKLDFPFKAALTTTTSRTVMIKIPPTIFSVRAMRARQPTPQAASPGHQATRE